MCGYTMDESNCGDAFGEGILKDIRWIALWTVNMVRKRISNNVMMGNVCRDVWFGARIEVVRDWRTDRLASTLFCLCQ